MKKLMMLLLFLLPLCFGSAVAEDAEDPAVFADGTWEYSLLDDGSVQLTRYLGDDENVVIPASMHSRAVTSLAEDVFYFNPFLRTVAIPDCVISISDGAFTECTSLSAYIVSPDHPVYAAIDGVLFSREDKQLLSYPRGLAAEDYTVPQGIRIIGPGAFSNAASLTSVRLPDSVVSIGNSAFSDCTSLVSITLPDSLLSIEDFAFIGCSALQHIDLNEGLIFIGSHAFMNCSSLTSVTFPGTVPVVQDYTFCHCSALESVVIREGTLIVGGYAFWDCPALRSITLPDSLTGFLGSAANECPLLDSIIVSPEHPVFVMTGGALYNMAECSLVLVPQGLKQTELVVAEGTVTIGELAIWNCDKLTSIVLPDTLVRIERYGISCCPALENITLPASVSFIGNSVLSVCENLRSITLLGDVQYIGDSFARFNDPELVVTVPRNSHARQWCVDHGIMYTYPDADSWLLQ